MVACLFCQLDFVFCFSGYWNGKCLYASVKKGLGVQLTTEKKFLYYPSCYFHKQVANWLVENRQKVMMVKKEYLQQTYGIQDSNATFPSPFSYKEYCRNVLDRRFWDDALILYAISCMWAFKITVVNCCKTLKEYHVHHTAPLKEANIRLVFNSSSHYTAAGRLSSILVACYYLTI